MGLVWSGLDNTKQKNDDMQKFPKHECNERNQSRNIPVIKIDQISK
jgi:hypothetical protein